MRLKNYKILFGGLFGNWCINESYRSWILDSICLLDPPALSLIFYYKISDSNANKYSKNEYLNVISIDFSKILQILIFTYDQGWFG